MKITFVLPAIGKKVQQKYIGTWKMEPITIAILKSLTPADIETEFYDDRLELINYDTPTDIVAITVETYTARRSYEIAQQFRNRGVTVIMGGYHPTLFPEEAGEYADCVVAGNAEPVWLDIINDFRNNKLKRLYQGNFGFSEKVPDRSIYSGKKYLPVTLIETGRGCCHSCEFCAISKYYCAKYYKQDHSRIIHEIEISKNKYHFLVDDNLIADQRNAMDLFKRMEPYQIKWAGQGTLAMAKDKELLRQMKKSGCELILIGFESLEEESLRQMNKAWNTTMGNRDELVKRIHDAGINIYATFVLGYDGDTPNTIDRTLEFARKHSFYTAAFNHLLPFPGTDLYERLHSEKRLLFDKWWLEENYHYGDLAFIPKSMNPEQLKQLCYAARKEFSNFSTVISRGIHSMKRSDPMIWMLFWAMNLRLGKEVDEKMNVPIGRNLDELPK